MKKLTKILLVVSLVCGFVVAQDANAGQASAKEGCCKNAEAKSNEKQQSDIIREQVEDALGEAVTKEIVRQITDISTIFYIDIATPDMDDLAIINESQNFVREGLSLGGAIVGFYNIAKSIDQFVKAEHDQQKLYSAASATSSALLLYSNPVGWIVAAALFAQNVIDADYYKRLSSIHKNTLEHWVRVGEVKTEILKAQWADFLFLLNQAVAYSNESSKLFEYVQKNCQLESEIIKDVALLEQCIGYTTKAIHSFKLSLQAAKKLFTLPTTDFDIGLFLIGTNQTTYGFLMEIKKLEAKLPKLNEIEKNLVSSFSKHITKLTIELSKKEGLLKLKDRKIFLCESLSLSLAQEMYKQTINFENEKSQADFKRENLLKLSSLSLHVNNFLEQDCEALVLQSSGSSSTFDIIQKNQERIKVLLIQEGIL